MPLKRYLTGLVWLCVLPLLALSVLLAVDHVHDVRAETERTAQALLHGVVQAVDAHLHAHRAALRLLARSPTLDARRPLADLHGEAQAFFGAYGSHVALVDAERRVLLHGAVPLGEPLPAAPREIGLPAPSASDTEPLVGDLYLSPVTQRPVIPIAVAVTHPGRAGHSLVALVRAPQFEDPLAEAVLPLGWSLAVCDGSGAIIARRGEVAADATPGGAPAKRYTERLTNAPWSVELDIPQSAYHGPVVKAATLVGAAVLLLALTSLLGGRWAAQRLARSIQSLAAGPEAEPDAPEVREVATVRRLLRDETRRRELAETDRRASEQRFRTTLEAASNRLRVSEARLRAIFDTAGEGIITVDGSRAIVMINRAAAHMFGYPSQALLGRSLDLLLPPRFRAGVHAALAAAAADLPRAIERGPALSGVRADGEEFPIEAGFSYVHLDGQQLYTVIVHDISRRLRAEEEVRTSRAKLDAALSSMTDAVIIVDADGRVIDFNDAFVRVHRFPSRDACPRMLPEYAPLFEVWTSEGVPVPTTQWAIARALRGETGSHVEYRMRRTDTGERWPCSYSFAPIRDKSGEIVGAVLHGLDTTEISRVRADLEASHAALQRLVVAQDSVQEKERKRIARELHDDLQQTLAAIKMDAIAIGRELQHDPQRIPPMLAKIEELAASAIASTRRIVNDLRPQILEELGLPAALEALAGDFRQRSGIDCRVDAEDPDTDSGAISPSVATCLYRVAQESLNNVLKHADARRVRMQLKGNGGGRLVLRIRDDGRGIGPGDRQKRHTFGLAGMNERLRAIGGTLRVDSRPGAGTVVEVDVPSGDEGLATVE